jgi:TetR/AcrR family transcriptional repressor of mexJK operon
MYNHPTGRRETRKLERREAVVIVAYACFLQNGYAGTTMSSIAAQLGGSKGTLWSYFPRKDELFAAVLDHATATFRAQLSNILKPCSDVELSLKQFCEGFIKRVISPESIASHRLVIAEAGRFPEIGEIFYLRAPSVTQNLLSEYLVRAMDEGRLRHGNPQDAAWLLVHLCLSGCREQC